MLSIIRLLLVPRNFDEWLHHPARKHVCRLIRGDIRSVALHAFGVLAAMYGAHLFPPEEFSEDHFMYRYRVAICAGHNLLLLGGALHVVKRQNKQLARAAHDALVLSAGSKRNVDHGRRSRFSCQKIYRENLN